ncbi:HTH domain-containing protein [Sulfitobacter pseudonitzschiae]|uniref:HTH domain-containing protein n=1 Tax=Pseudosulfitobacter pseudonitzschiae TaxID=1402135 RepID=A0A9Q2RXP3_9RHOB|nr:HTH domain-containing protein [Pseudosulfitobacter pseudonitzschiae]MBM2294684.1 HTH domain-containing protein [Pseudosulfitobacter pseudonitzschiae]MBM2299621.1 HTH domain-containing protein [Pseudosulfitobacter pseudonitzschiae]MBM2304542.1 HTH domain-containing protein [Pseudosulfitobacter pseudonitzschiae]MBM2314295.1 HTH domain-containing protein [Pseudosulfitobacter pseudonitzschiae]MBM2319233.1 HTH domain-containing protein [Pseudosulfitobacter pseudonitzschiae]
MTDRPRVPAQIEAIVEALGVDDAVEFLLAFGGTEVYIAERPTAKSMIVARLGMQKAQALAKVADRLPKRMPIQKPWIAKVLHAKGLTGAEIARKLHVTDYTVRRYLADARKRNPPDPDQLNLDL